MLLRKTYQNFFRVSEKKRMKKQIATTGQNGLENGLKERRKDVEPCAAQEMIKRCNEFDLDKHEAVVEDILTWETFQKMWRLEKETNFVFAVVQFKTFETAMKSMKRLKKH